MTKPPSPYARPQGLPSHPSLLSRREHAGAAVSDVEDLAALEAMAFDAYARMRHEDFFTVERRATSTTTDAKGRVFHTKTGLRR